jgi:hypothetical protein
VRIRCFEIVHAAIIGGAAGGGAARRRSTKLRCSYAHQARLPVMLVDEEILTA